MAESFHVTPTNLSPDRVHPCHVEDAAPSDLALALSTWGGMLACIPVIVLLTCGIVVVAALERVRAWFGGEARQ